MRKLTVGLALLACASIPQLAVAQEGEDAPPETSVVTVSTFHVPIGEERGKVLDFIERVWAPQARNNPNVKAFYVLQHYYGSDATEMALVGVYDEWADVEAPCGEPCQTWADENLPDEGEEGYEELLELGQTFQKYYRKHSDEIYTSRLDLAKM